MWDWQWLIMKCSRGVALKYIETKSSWMTWWQILYRIFYDYILDTTNVLNHSGLYRNGKLYHYPETTTIGRIGDSILAEKVNIPALRSVDLEIKTSVVPKHQFIRLAWNSITERTSLARMFRLHPQTHCELSQTGHAPDLDKVMHALSWKLESVVCNQNWWSVWV